MPPPTTTTSKGSGRGACRAASRAITAAESRWRCVHLTIGAKPTMGSVTGPNDTEVNRLKPPHPALAALGASLALAPAAHAQLPVPDPTGGVVGQVLGTVPAPVSSVLDNVLATGQGLLDPSTLGGLLGQLPTGSAPASGPGAAAPGAPGAPAGAVLAPGGVIDARPPTVSVKVLSHLHAIRSARHLTLRFTTSEPSLVAFTGSVRPGRQLKRKGTHRARAAAFRTPITFPRSMLAFRRKGSLQVKIAMSRSQLTRLSRARNARLSIALIGVDASRNQVARRLKLQVKR